MRNRGIRKAWIVALGFCPAIPALAADVDWASVPIVTMSQYQAVNANGSSAYTGGFPVRIVGVVIANTEDWLNPAAAYTPTYQPWNMGGQAELIVQSVTAGDFGGTFNWIGQNYGNVPWHADPAFNYTNAQWTAELARLGLYGGDGVTNPVRAGDLVEIRARIGLNYGGKMNVNESHNNSVDNDFEVVVLQRNYGLPTPTSLPLNLIKDAANVAIFDPTRATGGEHYQTTLVDLKNVKVISGTWAANSTVTVQDASNRTLNVYLGLNAGFAATSAPAGYFNVMGVVDQSSTTLQDGYRLLALDPSAIIRHGDINKDHRVSIHDFNGVLQNYTGFAGAGTTWASGNFNEAENGAVDIADFNATVANFTGNQLYGPETGVWTTPVITEPAMGPAALAVGELELHVDLITGQLTLVGNSAQVNNWDIYSPAGSLLPDADGVAGPWSGYLINNALEVAAFNGIGSAVSVDGELNLDVAYRLGSAMDLQFVYAGTNGSLKTGAVVPVPEPAALSLLALGLCGLLARRGRR